MNARAKQDSVAPGRKRRCNKVTVMVVGSPALSRIIGHLFASRPDFEVVGSSRGVKGLAPQAERLLPKLIVAGVKPVSSGVGSTVRAIRQASPLSKLILLCPVNTFVDSARRSGADACIDPEKLIAKLLPTASALSMGSRALSRTSEF